MTTAEHWCKNCEGIDPGTCLNYNLERRGLAVPAPTPPTVSEVNNLLGINLWDVQSFRAAVFIDFDEHGRIIGVNMTEPEHT